MTATKTALQKATWVKAPSSLAAFRNIKSAMAQKHAEAKARATAEENRKSEDSACEGHSGESQHDRRPLRPRRLLTEKRPCRERHQNRRDEIERDRLPKTEASDGEIEGHPAAKHHGRSNSEESLPRRDNEMLDEARSADRQRHGEDRGAPDKKHGPNRKSCDHLLGERVLQRKEHIGPEGQQDREHEGSQRLVARDSNHTSTHSFRLRVRTSALESRDA